MPDDKYKSNLEPPPLSGPEGESLERRELDPETYRLSGVLNVDRATQLVIDDRFIIVEELGRGGYGAVYKAFDESYGRYVAIKQMLPPRADDRSPAHMKREAENVRELRLQKEMQIMANLQHPNIVHVHEYINHTDTADGKYSYIVMELLVGESLYDRTRRLGRLAVSFAVDVAVQLINVIAYIHKNGYIHRDLKPENIIVLNEDSYGLSASHIKLLDFGLAIYKEAEQRLTESGFIGGTVWYLSPEQCEGEDADELSDLYSIGVMLFEMLTGELPYAGGTHNERLVQKLRHNYSNMPLLTDREDVPEVLKDFVQRSLSTNREERFASGKAMHAALAAILEVLPPDVEDPHAADPVLPYEAAAALRASPVRPTRSVRPGRVNMVLLAAILTILAVAIVGFALTWNQERTGEIALPPQPVVGAIDAGLDADGQSDVGVVEKTNPDIATESEDAAPTVAVSPQKAEPEVTSDAGSPAARPPDADDGDGTSKEAPSGKKPPRVLSLPGMQRERDKRRRPPGR